MSWKTVGSIHYISYSHAAWKEGGYVKTNFSWISGDVIWLSEFRPYLQPKMPIEGQMLSLLKDHPDCVNTYHNLMDYESEMNKRGHDISWSELGLIKDISGVKPIAIM